ncbi:MAG: transcription elongation factor GreA, partial [Hyphomicrobiales bacterium]
MQKVPMTFEGHASLVAEIKLRKTVERPQIIQA